jgi:hypothetical protein
MAQLANMQDSATTTVGTAALPADPTRFIVGDISSPKKTIKNKGGASLFIWRVRIGHARDFKHR